jgi:hypothetical protein
MGDRTLDRAGCTSSSAAPLGGEQGALPLNHLWPKPTAQFNPYGMLITNFDYIPYNPEVSRNLTLRPGRQRVNSGACTQRGLLRLRLSKKPQSGTGR